MDGKYKNIVIEKDRDHLVIINFLCPMKKMKFLETSTQTPMLTHLTIIKAPAQLS